MYLFEWLQKFRNKFGSQNLKLVNALLYSFVNILGQNRILEHYYHEWLLLSYYSALNNNIETFHILSVHFAILAQDDSADIGGCWRGALAD